ncbi:MAG: TrkA family potassium uptake protein, partial [Clostridia bacterium]|nr:TrkA family potassium uptake protein [Clostridia bacterium]
EIVYLLEKLHAKKIHCKADDDSQAKFLSIIGADHVIYPEREAAQSLAISEANDSIFNCIPMTDGYGVYEIATPGSWVGKTIKEASIYQIYRVNILATVNDGVISMMPPSSYRFNARDHLMVLGHQADIEKLP